MAFSQDDIQVLKEAKKAGKTKEQALAQLAKSRGVGPGSGEKPQAQQKPGLFSSGGAVGRAAQAVTNFVGADSIAKTYGAEIAKRRTDDPVQKQIISDNQPGTRETVGSALKTGSMFLGGGAVSNLGLKTLGKAAAYGAGAGYTYDIGQNLEDGENLPEALIPGAGAPIGAVAGVAGPAVGPVARAGGRAISSTGKFITQSPVVKGGLQSAVEFSERIPRFASRRNIELRNAATRAERIANSPEPIGKALKSGMDERIVNTIEQADEPTRSGFAEIVRLAEESNATDGTLKIKARPEIVAGEAAAEQYKLIDKQRKTVGQQIGDAVKNLPRDRVVPMAKPRTELNEALKDIGVSFVESDNGVTLNFAKTGFTKAQRAKINELYELATEGGSNLTPAQIHAKDRLFSQLQRETRMDGVGDIIVDVLDETGEPTKASLFQVFRDVYSDTLEEVAPEIRPLNRQYRNLSTFTDDIEKSIIKGGKYETNSNLDPSEFAQTNLRRLFSEAQSAADYRAIADELDAASRALGYNGATPSELAQFAYEIRKIYPETTPRTGFEGSIRSVGDALLGATKAGAPDVTDQQQALRDLIKYYETAQQAGG